MKALPKRINEHNIYRIDLMNFNAIQISLIAFQNDDQDELFQYYDSRNKKRLLKLKKKTIENGSEIETIKQIATTVLSLSSKALGMG